MRPRKQTETGAALLMALLIVALIASLAAAMVWRQFRAVQTESAERARSQADLMLRGALGYARLILKADKKQVDDLTEPWAVPLAEARVSTFLSQGQGVQDTVDAGPEAFLSGAITDAQALFNLRNLTGGSTLLQKRQQILVQLCAGAGVPSDTADRIIKGMRAAYPSPNIDPATAPLQPVELDQLAWFGLAPETIERLRPLLVILPAETKVNINTAPREVLAALWTGMDLAAAERIVQGRKTNPLTSVADAQQYLPGGVSPDGDVAETKSDFFFVFGRLRLDDRVLQERSLIQRNTSPMTASQRRQISQVAPAS